MKRQAGFTLIEILVSMVIIGVLAATAVGFQAKYRQRTVGSEALVMMKQLLEAEIIYFLANNEFFPKVAGGANDIWVLHSGGGTSAVDQQRALNALKVAIPDGHLLDFHVYRDAVDSAGSPVTVEITSAGGFTLFPNAPLGIYGTVDKRGKIIGPEAL
jgi:prepilin-type N-terminal cleavage/methylation domain-containing protein